MRYQIKAAFLFFFFEKLLGFFFFLRVRYRFPLEQEHSVAWALIWSDERTLLERIVSSFFSGSFIYFLFLLSSPLS